MKTYALLLLFLGFFVNESLAQKEKIKINNEIATVDGVDFVQMKRDYVANAISIHELGSGEEVIFMRFLEYNTSTNNDPSTKVSWVELNFLNQNQICEINTRGQKGLVRFLKENNLIVNGELNTEAITKVIRKYGTNFSDNRPDSVIIINN
ncbi:hypothetical protein N9355_07740 [Crocinitomicaceae bacterium]|nr:hypothetical protein [Crocinitomicaceae bacterium]